MRDEAQAIWSKGMVMHAERKPRWRAGEQGAIGSACAYHPGPPIDAGALGRYSFIALVVLELVIFLLFLRRLRARFPEKWAELGSPKAMSVLSGRGLGVLRDFVAGRGLTELGDRTLLSLKSASSVIAWLIVGMFVVHAVLRVAGSR